MLGLLTLVPPAAAQSDSVPVGLPPHFAAAWAPAGTLIDISQTEALQQRISLSLIAVPIDTAIMSIVQQIESPFVYRPEVLPVGRTVSIRAAGITIAAALAEVLRNTEVDVVMTQGGRFALVKCTHLQSAAAWQGNVVAGRITDRTTGAPLAGATVTADSGRFSTVANTDGQYRLAGLPAGGHVVTVRYIGYTPAIDTVVAGPAGVLQDFSLAPSAHLLEQVVVTGTLVPTEVKALPTPITIITADEIRRQNVTRITQLFRGQVAGALAWDRAADDHYNTINVRGAASLSPRSIKTFVDGVEVADPQFTALIDPNSIERIELTRGSQASTMYGSDAIGGVLQIFTKKGSFRLLHPEGEVKASTSLLEKNDGAGTAARFEGAASVRGSEQRTRYQASGYYRHDGEWTPDYHNTNWSVIASAENIQGPLTSRISAMFARKAFDFPAYTALRDLGYTFASRPFFQTIDLQTQTYGVNFVYTATPWWRHDLVLGYDRWAFGSTQTEPRLTTPDDTLLQVIMNQRGKLSIFYFTTVNARLGRGASAALTAGFNHYALDGSDAIAPGTIRSSGTLTGPSTILRLSSTNTGYFAQTQINLAETVFLTAGVRAERSPGFGEDVGTVVSPRFGAAYVRPLGAVTAKLRASYGESIRAPEVSQNQAFVSAGFEQLHNPALRPERQRGSDAGVDLSWGTWASLSATYYSQDAIDLIDFVLGSVVGDPPRQQTQEQNVGRIRNRGWEFEARYTAQRIQLTGAFSATYSRIWQLDPHYTGNYRVDDRLFDVPLHTAGITAAYSLSPATALRASVTNVGRWVDRDLVAFYGVTFGGLPPRPSGRDYWITYPGFTRLRAGIDRKLWRGITGSFDIENITNTRAFETNNLAVPSPRIFAVSLRAPY